MTAISNSDKFQESLEALDLQGLILVIGLLSQRALELMMKEKEQKKSIIPGVIVPDVTG